MKKFLTFFAMMFALLGFSIPASAADYTVYVDVSAKGWSDCYLKTHWVDGDQNGWNIPTATKTDMGNGLYKFVFRIITWQMSLFRKTTMLPTVPMRELTM